MTKIAQAIPVGDVTNPNVVRFCSRVHVQRPAEDQESGNGCWAFDAYHSTKGYPQFWMEGRAHWAHRVSHRIFKGEIPAGHHVHHECGNRWCVNPDHLSTMDPSAHADDSNERKRRHAEEEALEDIPI